MAAYNFQKQFVPLIESGGKQSTIRQRRKNGYLPREGDVLRLYQGMRTKACKLIREVAVARISPIVVNARLGCADVILNGVRLNDGEIYEMAAADGFKSIRAFAEFFEEKYGPELNAYLI
jgi:hypothetical protein